MSVNGGFFVNSTSETSLGRYPYWGPTSKAGCQNHLGGVASRLDPLDALREQHVETGGLREEPEDDGAAALRRLRVRAARAGDGEERDGECRHEG